MDIKKFSIPFFIMVGILASLEILFFIKVLFSDYQGFEWGSVTDWVSALCNVAMASAAVYAALQAKKWLKPKLNQNGLPDAIEFLKKDVKTLLSGIIPDTIFSKYDDLICVLEEVIESNRNEVAKRYNAIKYEFISMEKTFNLKGAEYIKDFNLKKSELIWYGYSLREEKQNTINEIFKLRSQYFSAYENKILELKQITKVDFFETVQRSDSNSIKRSLEMLQRARRELGRLDKQQRDIHLSLTQLHKELMGDNPAITDFFDIK